MKYDLAHREVKDTDPYKWLAQLGLQFFKMLAASSLAGHSDIRFTLGYPYMSPGEDGWDTQAEIVCRAVTGESPVGMFGEIPALQEMATFLQLPYGRKPDKGLKD